MLLYAFYRLFISYFTTGFSLVPRNVSHLETASKLQTSIFRFAHFDIALSTQALNSASNAVSYSSGVFPLQESKRIEAKTGRKGVWIIFFTRFRSFRKHYHQSLWMKPQSYIVKRNEKI